jgi:hypothetical protein
MGTVGCLISKIEFILQRGNQLEMKIIKVFCLIIMLLFCLQLTYSQKIDSLTFQKNEVNKQIKILDSSYSASKYLLNLHLRKLDSLISILNQKKIDDSIIEITNPLWVITNNFIVSRKKPDIFSEVVQRIRDRDSLLIDAVLIGKNSVFARTIEHTYVDINFLIPIGEFKIHYDKILALDIKLKNEKLKRELDSIENRSTALKDYENMRLQLKNIYRDDEVVNLILRREIRIGMTDDMIIIIKGKPREINRSVYSFGTKEQWIYGNIEEREYYYFENGKLTSWSDKR